jgi:phosphatidylinositol alpha 1,6-mannosyltransferase
VKIVIVAETFLPQMNGVVNSVLQMLRHLQSGGHEVLVIAPGTAHQTPGDEQLHGAELALLRSVPLPTYPDVRITFASALRLRGILASFRPDVVHLASPFVLGWQALRAAESLGIPTVAVYQTDIPGYAQRYGIAAATSALAAHVTRLHNRATMTLAPSSSSIAELQSIGVDRVRLWARGVDGERFSPAKRDEAWRREVAPHGELLIGYVGRLAPEKQVEDLRALAGIAGTRIVIVGDGPSRPALEAALPTAVFLGFQSGDRLAAYTASLDVFVHPGENETFCQTVQEALASGVPVVATGRGGPVDLVQNSRTGWLYRPGDLDDLAARVRDLVGDPAKRRAFSAAARASVAHRTWASLGDELVGHYCEAIGGTRRAPEPAQWKRYVAVGDSLTEGLCDSSRQAPGEFRGWADRLAELLAHSGRRREGLLYANLAVRSRRISDVVDHQLPRARELRADLVSVLVGANDLVQLGARSTRLAHRLGQQLEALRATGADVLVVAPFAPRRRYLGGLQRRIQRFNAVLRSYAESSGCMLLDFSNDPACADPRTWAEDRVHLSSQGHRLLSYRAAAVLGVPGAATLGDLDVAMHDEVGADDAWVSNARWLWLHVRPWMGRRLLGRTAGDGRVAKHSDLVRISPPDRRSTTVAR